MEREDDMQCMVPVGIRDDNLLINLYDVLSIKYEHFDMFHWSSSQQGKTKILETKKSVHKVP